MEAVELTRNISRQQSELRAVLSYITDMLRNPPNAAMVRALTGSTGLSPVGLGGLGELSALSDGVAGPAGPPPSVGALGSFAGTAGRQPAFSSIPLSESKEPT